MEPVSTTIASAAEQAEAPAAPLPYLVRREPVLDQNHSLAGYRLRLLRVGASDAAPDIGTAVAQAARAHGVSAFFAYLPHWIDGTPTLLNSTFAHTLPRHHVYLELLEDTEATPELVQTLHGLAHNGLQFSIRGDLAAQAPYAALLPFCKVVCFDPAHSTKADIFRQSFQHKQAGRRLMAAHVPNKASLDNFLLLGFTLFLGRWPADRVVTAALTPRQKTLLQLVALVMGKGESPEIQACLQHDPELAETLLDKVNTPAYGLSQEVQSLNQAIMLLGRRQLQRWVQMFMYTESSRAAGYLSPALIQASARAYLMEALSKQRYPDKTVRAEAAFTTGMLSNMDQLFHGTLADLLSNMPVDVAVHQALLQHEGELGQELRLVTLLFPSDHDPIVDPTPILSSLALDAATLAPLVQESFTWAHSMTQAAP